MDDISAVAKRDGGNKLEQKYQRRWSVETAPERTWCVLLDLTASGLNNISFDYGFKIGSYFSRFSHRGNLLAVARWLARWQYIWSCQRRSFRTQRAPWNEQWRDSLNFSFKNRKLRVEKNSTFENKSQFRLILSSFEVILMANRDRLDSHFLIWPLFYLKNQLRKKNFNKLVLSSQI